MSKKKIIIDDGFNPEFVETAMFDGFLEMPCIERPKEIIIPEKVIPLTELNQSENYQEMIIPYVYDTEFGDILRNPGAYVERFSKFLGMTALDNSLYIDSPLLVQMANVYRSRAIGYYFQKKGLYVVPNIRWGDERSYTTEVLPEKFAFLGVPKHSIVSVGTYGACKTREEKYHMRHGMIAMLDELQPEVVLIYGAMPEDIFFDLHGRTQFVQYNDWTSLRKRRDN